MFFNPNVFVVLLLTPVFFFTGSWISKRFSHPGLKILTGFALFILSLPGLSFVAYYTHFFGEPIWYYQFRSVNHIEALSSLSGFFFGFITYKRPPSKSPSSTRFHPAALNKYLLILCLLLVLIPFIKPILLPATKDVEFEDRWKENVCLQSSGSTCGPASLATIFRYFNMPQTEVQIAKACYSSSTGTEAWYLIRYARTNGLKVIYPGSGTLSNIPVPSILGTRLGSIGHFVTLLGKSGENYIIGDPLNGKALLSEEQFKKTYTFSGFAISFETAGY